MSEDTAYYVVIPYDEDRTDPNEARYYRLGDIALYVWYDDAVAAVERHEGRAEIRSCLVIDTWLKHDEKECSCCTGWCEVDTDSTWEEERHGEEEFRCLLRDNLESDRERG